MSRFISGENLSQKLSEAAIRSALWKAFRSRFLTFKIDSRWLLMIALLAIFGTVALFEARTSQLEAKLLSAFATRLSYDVKPGPSESIAFPSNGPFNEVRGYVGLPAFARRLADDGYEIVAQARQSSALQTLSRWKITPPFREPAAAGLIVRGDDGTVLYDASARGRVFKNYDDIPPLIIETLLFVEDRELADSDIPTENPVVDWSRLGKAGLTYAGHKIGLPVRIEGGSTLATQIEKFRYAEGGRTGSAADKLRQMLSASLRVYRTGTDTRLQRREIVLDYLNSVPLAAAPGYGEVYGLGNGLYAWFGLDLNEAQALLTASPSQPAKQQVFKHVLALICAARAPSFYLVENRAALEARLDFYARQLAAAGVIPKHLAEGIESVPVEFLPHAPEPPAVPYVERKATNALRNHLLTALGAPGLYTLDRLHLEADTALNVPLQKNVLGLLQQLKDPGFVASHGLREQHLLERGDPAQVTYSFTLFERTPAGNLLRVQADTLNQPLDLNEGMKLELGSTAKLRTLAHYLELIASLYQEFHGQDATMLKRAAESARDPITRWTAETLAANSGMSLADLLDEALDRKYSGDPGEVFFTGGGAHTFGNFDSDENGAVYTLRDGFYHSVNLVYIRLMRDLMRFHQARLPYDTEAVLNSPDGPVRLQLLHEIADKESQQVLFHAYQSYRGLAPQAIVEKLLGSRSKSARHLAMLFFAWNHDGDPAGLSQWLESHGVPVSSDEAKRLMKSYDPARLNISDYGYLLDRHPLDVWCAGELLRQPAQRKRARSVSAIARNLENSAQPQEKPSWNDLLDRSAGVREIASRWLFKTRNRHAQDLRLRIRFEEDAFARMTPYWQKLGFPFDHLVPSLATAIGSSADRPIALAELVGIVLNNGLRRPTVRIERLRFAADTPYETVFSPRQQNGTRVMEAEVAQVLRQLLAGVVQNGTARRLVNVFKGGDGTPIVIGGKTGSGDNRYETRSWSRAVSRTGTFAFYIGDRYFGVITAYVGQDKAASYGFTSALPLTALKLLAPTLVASLDTLH